YCSVSSVMPQKKNPDTLELTRSKCAQVISECINSALIIKSIPTGYFRDFQDLKPLLINSFRKTHQIIEILTGIFSTININTDIMKKVVNNSFLLALDLAELFVQEFNIPFREAHNIIGNLVNISKNTDGLFNVEKINASIRKYTDKKIELTEDHLKNIKDLENCLSRRISKGSPSPKEIEAFLSNVQTKRQEKEKNLKFRKQKIKKAKEERQKIIDDLIS
ncbi:MAG: lyase family protein, partial [Promethearchaeia archaeon]